MEHKFRSIEIQKSNEAAQESKTKTCNKSPVVKPDIRIKFSHIDPPETSAVLLSEGENLSYFRLKLSNQIKRKVSANRGSSATALHESSNDYLNFKTVP